MDSKFVLDECQVLVERLRDNDLESQDRYALNGTLEKLTKLFEVVIKAEAANMRAAMGDLKIEV